MRKTALVHKALLVGHESQWHKFAGNKDLQPFLAPLPARDPTKLPSPLPFLPRSLNTGENESFCAVVVVVLLLLLSLYCCCRCPVVVAPTLTIRYRVDLADCPCRLVATWRDLPSNPLFSQNDFFILFYRFPYRTVTAKTEQFLLFVIEDSVDTRMIENNPLQDYLYQINIA